MASVSTCSRTGLQRLLFRMPDGTRVAVYMGRTERHQLIEAGFHIDQIVESRRMDDIPRRSTREWIERVDRELPILARRLRKLGLIAGPNHPDSAIADFAAAYVERRKDVRPNTRRSLRQTVALIQTFFGTKTIRQLTPADGRDFFRWMKSAVDQGGRGFQPSTAGKHITNVKAVLNDAVERRILSSNPFQKIAAGRRFNTERRVFVEGALVQEILTKITDPELCAILALSRWGGLRTPSEHYAMLWSDIDWVRKRIRVRCIKTETRGKTIREIPLFPELVTPLQTLRDVRPSAAPSDPVIRDWSRLSDSALRKQVSKIIVSNAYALWPRLFQNLRSSRQTELEERFPRKTVCEWMGNSEMVADQHYLMVRQEHFDRACQEDLLSSVWYSC